MDETLSFRKFLLRVAAMPFLLMRINGKRRFACITLVKPGDQVTVEPLTYPEDTSRTCGIDHRGRERGNMTS